MGRQFIKNEIIENENYIIVKTASKFKGTQEGKEKALQRVTLIDSKYKYLLDDWKIIYDNSKDNIKDIEITKGYFIARNKDTKQKVRLHRLIYCLEKGLELNDIKNKHIHHLNGLSWDNKAINLDLVTMREHKVIENKTKHIEYIEDKYFVNENIRIIHSLYKNMELGIKPIGELPKSTQDRDLLIKQVEEYMENNKHIFN